MFTSLSALGIVLAIIVGCSASSSTDNFTTNPTPIHQVAPRYPEEALVKKLEGTVLVKGFIEWDGSVQKAMIYKSDNSIFNDAALEAAAQWKFSLAKDQQGNPVRTWVIFPIRFKLDK